MATRRLTPTDWDGYAARWAALHGGIDPRRSALPVRGWLMLAYRLARGLIRIRIGPGAVTWFAILLGVAVPVIALAGDGWPALAGLLVAVGALVGTLDGAVALVGHRMTRLGYVYDSLADRVTEGCWLAAFWVVGSPLWLVIGAGAVSWLHEYLRARATAAGMSGIGTVSIGERPTRVVVGACGLGLAGAGGTVSQSLAIGGATLGLTAWALFGVAGFGQLLSSVRQHLG